MQSVMSKTFSSTPKLHIHAKDVIVTLCIGFGIQFSFFSTNFITIIVLYFVYALPFP